MKFKGLNNKEYVINTAKYVVYDDDQKKRSELHLTARNIIREIYKTVILEEMKLPGTRDPSKKSTLFVDFFIPSIRVAVEVHGRQHYEYVPFFHKNKIGFIQHQKRDQIKREWCELNQIQLIELDYRNVGDWRRQLTEL